MRLGIWVFVLALPASVAAANPRVDDTARTMAIPRQWLEQEVPTPASRAALVRLFAVAGIDLNPATVQLIERNFDRFAPVMVEAQSPPNVVRPDLQRWFRAHADRAQADAMKVGLRAWLDFESERPGAGTDRMYAIESLGDWRDSEALPRLRSLPPSPILTASIRRIEDPEHADPFVVRRDGRLKLQRPADELDSVVVVAYDPIRMENTTWRPIPKSERGILDALGRGTRVPRLNERRTAASALVGTIYLTYHDGREVRLASNADRWRLYDDGRLDSPTDVLSPDLDEAIDRELTRVGILPSGPRFIEESVNLFIERDELRVRGVYVFEGRAPRTGLALDYPFPADSTIGKPRLDLIFLDTNSASGSTSRVEVNHEATPWHIVLKPGDAMKYQLTLEYRQDLHGRSATYLVRSALDWKRPLRKAFFYVAVDEDLGTPHLNYPFEKGPGGRYAFHAAPFRPERDLVVRW